MDDVIFIHATLDLIYSADDGGWYFDDYDEDRTSVVYLEKPYALAAYRADQIEWQPEQK